MRCDAVIRELAVPTDERDSTALAEHVAQCPACAAWAKCSAGLDRLWEATRPPEPSAEVWDVLWSRLARSLDASLPNELESFTRFVPYQNGSSAQGESQPLRPLASPHSRRARWAAIGLIGLAQAAAVLLAVGLSWQVPPTITVASEAIPIVIEDGSLIVIHADPKPTVVQLHSEGRSFGFDGGFDEWYSAFNAVEALAANPVVAME